jgi:hypothetical protein
MAHEPFAGALEPIPKRLLGFIDWDMLRLFEPERFRFDPPIALKGGGRAL